MLTKKLSIHFSGIVFEINKNVIQENTFLNVTSKIWAIFVQVSMYLLTEVKQR